MSSILKALRKLEQEQNSRKSGIVDITGQVIYKKDRPRRQTWRVPFGMAAVGITTAIGTYFLTTVYSHNGNEHPAPISPAVRQQIQAAAPPQPVEAPPSNVRDPLPAVAAATKKASAPEHFPPALPRLKGRKVATPSPPVVAPQPTAAPSVQPSPPPLHQQATAPAQTVAAPLPTLNISGVAYEADGGKFAIINGIAVTEGSVVAGAKVEEIQKDRIRFTFGQKTFDVPVVKK